MHISKEKHFDGLQPAGALKQLIASEKCEWILLSHVCQHVQQTFFITKVHLEDVQMKVIVSSHMNLDEEVFSSHKLHLVLNGSEFFVCLLCIVLYHGLHLVTNLLSFLVTILCVRHCCKYGGRSETLHCR